MNRADLLAVVDVWALDAEITLGQQCRAATPSNARRNEAKPRHSGRSVYGSTTMTVTVDAINHGIVLASILAGFAFAIAAQVALAADRSPKMQALALMFLLSGTLSIASIVFGMLRSMSTGDSARMQTQETNYFLTLFFAVFMLVVGVMAMIDIRFAHTGVRRVAYLLLIGLVVFVCVQILDAARPLP